MVDRPLVAKKVADVRDAVERIRSVLPADRDRFLSDRTAREIVVLNLFVALQVCLDLATHWLADAGWDVPRGYRELFAALADHGVITHELAARMGQAAGLRNLLAHRYGALDWSRIHAIAGADLDHLIAFCESLARQTGPDG